MIRSFAIALILASSASAAEPAQFNKKVKIGEVAPSFTDLPGIDGKKHSFAEFKDKDVLVVGFICNHCPVAEAYEDRIVAFAKKYTGGASKVGLVAICVDNYEVDKLPAMIVRAKEKKFNFVYVHDESQNIGRAYGATVTPQFFVLNKERKIAYMGAIDDDIDDEKVKDKYLELAVDAVLAGKLPKVTETPGQGCSIEYESKNAPATPVNVPKLDPNFRGEVKLKTVKFDELTAAIKSHQGKVVVVDVWATFCPPCMKEFPHFVEMHRKYGKDIVCISVTVDDEESKEFALKFLTKQQAATTNYHVDYAPLQKAWVFSGVPVARVYAPSGEVAKQFTNSDPDRPAFTYVEVEAVVKELLKK